MGRRTTKRPARSAEDYKLVINDGNRGEGEAGTEADSLNPANVGVSTPVA